jgi:DNA-binding IclR family transcriptional regulator
MTAGISPPSAALLDRAFALLSAFEDGDEWLGLADLCDRTGLPKSTVHRLAATLVQLGVMTRGPSGYGLGRRLFELGCRVSNERRLRELAIPYMEELYETTHETVHLAVLDGADVLYLEKLHGRQARPVPTAIGGRVPAACTGLGKAMLAYADRDQAISLVQRGLPRRSQYSITDGNVFWSQLQEIRRVGVAFDREEAVLGVVCAAAPIIDRHRRPVGAISVSGPSANIDLDALGRKVRAVGEALSRLWSGGRSAGQTRTA